MVFIKPPFAQPQNQEHHEDQLGLQKLVDKVRPKKVEPVLGQDDVHKLESEAQAPQQPVRIKYPSVCTTSNSSSNNLSHGLNLGKQKPGCRYEI